MRPGASHIQMAGTRKASATRSAAINVRAAIRVACGKGGAPSAGRIADHIPSAATSAAPCTASPVLDVTSTRPARSATVETANPVSIETSGSSRTRARSAFCTSARWATQ